MNVLVVGGAGYIGGCVTDELIRRKIPFTVFDNLTYENHFLKPVDFIYGDIRDKKLLKKILPKYSHIIWLAALVGDGACAIKPLLTKSINEDPVKWLSSHYSGRIVFTSTCSVYGINTNEVNENSPTNPLSVYAQTKLEAEKSLDKKNAIIFRLGTAFGIGDSYSRIRMDLAVNYMTMNAIKNKKLTIFGGKQWRPFIHVRDIARVIVESLNRKETGIYNIATKSENIFNVALEIKKITNCKIQKALEKFQDDRSYFANVSKADNSGILPKKTKYTIKFGIDEVKDLVISNRIKDLDLQYYSNEKFMLQIITKYEAGFLNTPL